MKLNIASDRFWRVMKLKNASDNYIALHLRMLVVHGDVNLSFSQRYFELPDPIWSTVLKRVKYMSRMERESLPNKSSRKRGIPSFAWVMRHKCLRKHLHCKEEVKQLIPIGSDAPRIYTQRIRKTYENISDR